MCINGKLGIAGIAGIVTGVLAIGYAYLLQRKVDKAYNLIDRSIDEISKDMPVDISKEIVEQAITKAVDREINRAIKDASYEVTNSIRKDIERDVRSAIDGEYSNIRTSVAAEVSRQVANIDIKRLKQEVKERAKELVIDKFNGDLDSLLNDFNQNLTNVSKIYNSIADSMTKKKESETVLRII